MSSLQVAVTANYSSRNRFAARLNSDVSSYELLRALCCIDRRFGYFTVRIGCDYSAATGLQARDGKWRMLEGLGQLQRAVRCGWENRRCRLESLAGPHISVSMRNFLRIGSLTFHVASQEAAGASNVKI